MAHFTLDRIVLSVKDLRAITRNDDPIALFQIGYLLGQVGQRQSIRAKVHLTISIPDHER